MESDLTFGQWLKRRRRGLGLTQRSLGQQVGYASETIRKVEADELRPSRQLAERLAAALHLAPDEQARFVQFARDEPQADEHGLSTQTVQFQGAAEARRHNLPAPLTPLIGREHDIDVVTALLAAHRLLTLTGVGGVGKTSLALGAAHAALEPFSGQVWLIELAALFDPALVAQAAGSVLGLPDSPGRPALETLTRFLRDRELLLVLDNCEHLLAGCAPLAHTLLRACPRLKILATSREPLGVAGEAVFPVPSLPWPAAGPGLSLEQIGGYASVRLFTDRARLIRPDYQLSAHNAAAVAAVCRRLDGLPLAIEMAAARLNTLSADQLVSRLDAAFGLLTGGSRTTLPRQQTMRATLDWSYNLLAEAERLLLQRLAVFAGGCLLEAAEAVCAGDGLEAGQVLEGLNQLVAKSLVVVDRQLDEPRRFHLLEMVRQYAGEKLEAAGETARLRTRQRDYFTAFAEAHDPDTPGADKPTRIRALHREVDNLRAALEWSFQDEAQPEAGPKLICWLAYFWPAWQEWLAWSQRAVAWCRQYPAISPELQIQVLSSGSSFVGLNDPLTAVAWTETAVTLCREMGAAGAKLLMGQLRHLGWLYVDCAQVIEPAEAAYREGRALLEALGPDQFPPDIYTFYQAWFASGEAYLADKQGHYPEAKRLALDSRRLFEVSGRKWALPSVDTSVYLASACLHLGEYDEARQHLHAAVQLSDEVGGDQGLNRKTFVLRWLGLAELWAGNLEAALAYCQASIRLANEVPDYNIIASCLGLCAGVAAKQGQAAQAARLAGASHAMYARQHRKPWEDSALETLLPGWRAGPDAAALEAAYAVGQALPADTAIAEALEMSAATRGPSETE